MWNKLKAFFIRKPSGSVDAEQNQSELICLLERAGEFAAKRNMSALEDLQRLVMRTVQSLHVVDPYLKPDHKAIAQFHEWNKIGLNHFPGLNDTFIGHETKHPIKKDLLPIARLGRDIVLPTCWHPSSIVNVLGSIGEGRRNNPWSPRYKEFGYAFEIGRLILAVK